MVAVVLNICRLRVMRKTHALIQVILVLMDDPLEKHWGYELTKRGRLLIRTLALMSEALGGEQVN